MFIKKTIVLLLLSVFYYTCQSSQNMLQKPYLHTSRNDSSSYVITKKIEILPRQNLHLEKDETGKKYIKILPGNKIVFKYLYKKYPKNQNLMDVAYMQSIYFETDNLGEMKLTDRQLTRIKLTVETAGYRNRQLNTIDKGSLQWKQTAIGTYILHLKIDSTYTHILIKEITQTLNLTP